MQIPDQWINHPEAREGEVFLTNSSDENGDNDMAVTSWKTKRRGQIAYDIHGRPIHGSFPIFVKAGELRAAGINPDTLCDDWKELDRFLPEDDHIS